MSNVKPHTRSKMPPPLLSRDQYGPPEHFDDEIRAYRTSARYVPTALESLLYELAGHRCTLCHAPWLEIHHIQELSEGGSTEYDNLVVLCPNCHTRVHAEGIPSKEELRHYKRKQEIAYELPVLSRLSLGERQFLSVLANVSREAQLSYSRSVHREISAASHDEAVALARHDIGFFELLEAGMVSVDLEHAIGTGEQLVSVSIRLRLTGKGVKWLRYLRETDRVPSPEA